MWRQSWIRRPGNPAFLPHADPERVETLRREIFGKHPLPALGPGQLREQLCRLRPEPDGARSGLGIFEPGACAVLAELTDLAPLEVEHFGKPRARQRQQADRRDRPGVLRLVAVQDPAEAFELVAVEKARHGLARVLDDVGAGVGGRALPARPTGGPQRAWRGAPRRRGWPRRACRRSPRRTMPRRGHGRWHRAASCRRRASAGSACSRRRS